MSATTSLMPPPTLSLMLRTSIFSPAAPRIANTCGTGRRRTGPFVAARPGADFEDDVLFVVGILGNEQHLDFGEEAIALDGQRAQLLLRELAHVEGPGAVLRPR